MQIKCDYCDAFINDTDEFCPHCGGVNSHMMRVATGLPKTIEELKAYAAANNLPLQQMRFFIGEDFKEPRAFGIFEKNGVFTVYKNKADGTRAIRYQGTDEAYAVHELYQKMHDEIMLRKGSGSGTSAPVSSKKKLPKVVWIFLIIWAAITIFSFVSSIFSSCGPSRGYYNYGGDTYYYQGGSWYGYDDDTGWYSTNPDSGLTDNYSDYYDGSSYESGSDYSDFSDSDYYYSGNDSDWDNNDSWDGGDWDSGGSDWDSDW